MEGVQPRHGDAMKTYNVKLTKGEILEIMCALEQQENDDENQMSALGKLDKVLSEIEDEEYDKIGV